MTQKNFDLIIIGGGAAGIIAAISSKRHHPTLSVAILDRTFALGRKILVCGAGRCNITNRNLNTSVTTKYYGAKPEFISSVFAQFPYEKIVEFFNDLGVELYIERKTQVGKLFPVTDQAKTITNLLDDELKRLGIEVFLNTECRAIQKSDKLFKVEAVTLENNAPKGDPTILFSKNLIISAGGKTYPALGSNGSGYTLAQNFGHSLIQPVASALPLVGKNLISQEANGTKMEIEVSSIINGQQIKTTTDDVMFTQYGLSGPAILNISREISIHLKRYNQKEAIVQLNFFPGKTKLQVQELLRARWRKRPDQTVEMSLNGIFPPKLPPIILKLCNIPLQAMVSNITASQEQTLLETLTTYQIIITDTRGWNEAEFTAGGINTDEIKIGTLESKKVPGLYFCGEILDVDGDVGGFNLSWAWSSGFVAGKLL